MSELIKRRIEAVAGLYNHNVAKFIHFVMMNYEPKSLMEKKDLFRGNNVQSNQGAYYGGNPVIQYYEYCKDEIQKMKTRIFKTNIAYSTRDSNHPRVMLLSNNGKTEIASYMNWMDDSTILDRCILPLAKFDEIARKDAAHFTEIHMFLQGFEFLLSESLIPSFLQGKYQDIERQITLPVIIAFRDFFVGTRFTFGNYVVKGIDQREMEYIRKLKLDLASLTIFVPDIGKEYLELWLRNFNGAYYVDLCGLYLIKN